MSSLAFRSLRSFVCHELHKRPDPNNWSAPNVDREVHTLIDECEWPKVYDILERLAEDIERRRVAYDDNAFVRGMVIHP